MPPSRDDRSANRIQLVKSAPPPMQLPIYGNIKPEEVSFIGRTNYVAALEEKRFIFGIKRADRCRHVYLIGKAGVGKSKLTELLVRQDVSFGYGLCLIDPHGEMIEETLSFIPEERVGDVVVIDPLDTAGPAAFNPLANIEPSARHQLVAAVTEAFKQHFGAEWNTTVEHITRFTLLALTEFPGATLANAMDMLTKEAFRSRVIAAVTDPVVKGFWTEHYPELVAHGGPGITMPLVSQLSRLLANPFLRHFLTSSESKVDFHELIQDRRIVLVNLARHRLGEQSAAFFGALILAKLKEAGIARASQPAADRKDFYIYLDELPSMATDTFRQLLGQARTYGFCMTMANQYFGQIPDTVQAALLGHVGTMVVFRVAGEDAVRLKPEMAPVFDVRDMINLGSQQFYIRMTIDGEAYDSFSGETLKLLPPPHASFRDRIMENSRAQYGAPRA